MLPKIINQLRYCLLILFILSGLTACNPDEDTPQAESQPSPVVQITQPVQVATLPPSLPTHTANEVPSPIPSPQSTAKSASSAPLTSDFAACPLDTCIQKGHFWFSSPIDPAGSEQIDATYRYASTQNMLREIHHGVDIKNEVGIPVLAVADGEVNVAGDDKQTAYGPETEFYGNLVILKHDFPEYPKPVFSLYGHLSKVLAQSGQKVKRGEPIGLVGMTGIAIGYHLHFEVRVGVNDYDHTRNPELWLLPQKMDMGALAGRLVAKDGSPVRVAKVVLNGLDQANAGLPIYLDTYDDPPIPHELGSRDDSFLMPYTTTILGRDDDWREDFALSNLPAGQYRLSFSAGQVYQKDFEIKPGQITLLKIEVGE